ncbi:MAG: glycosyl transferase, partial [Gemmatimonadota bacterium]
PTLVIRAGALEELGGYRDRGWPEDWDLLLRLHAAGMRAANVGRRLLLWRRGEGRLSRTSGRYSREAFRRCRVHHLLRDGVPEGRPLVVWGAGSVGKRFARELRERGGRVRAWVEVDPRKVGQEIHGLPVWSPGELARELSAGGSGARPYALVAVGAPGAREEIREELGEMGLAEGEDFRAVA